MAHSNTKYSQLSELDRKRFLADLIDALHTNNTLFDIIKESHTITIRRNVVYAPNLITVLPN